MVIFHSYVSLPEVPILKLSWDWDLTFLWRIISTSLRWLQHHRIPIPPFQEESGDLNSSLRRLMTWVWATTQNMQTLPGKCVSSIYVGFPGEISSYQNSGCKLDQSYPLAMKHGLLDNLHLVPWFPGQPWFFEAFVLHDPGPRLLSQVKRGWERTKSGLEFYTSGLQLLWQDGGHCIAVWSQWGNEWLLVEPQAVLNLWRTLTLLSHEIGWNVIIIPNSWL
jgi:hypothetical protein